MKKLLLATAAVATLGLSSGSALAGNSATATVGASATVVTPIALDPKDSLDFGSFVAPATGDGIGTVDTAGLLTDVTMVPGSQSTPTAATVAVAGEPGFYYDITVPASVDLQNGADLMSATLLPEFLTGTLDSTTGSDSFDIDGILGVAENQPSGTYTGSFDVTVTYQ